VPIFGREEEGAMTPEAPKRGRSSEQAGSRQTTYIAPGSRIEGTISGPTELYVEGAIEGRLELENSVVVGEPGSVSGEITARSVRIGGKVQATVKARERVEVLSGGRLEGNVAAPRVVITDGAFFKGQIEMTGESKGRAPQGTSAASGGPKGGAE
jgi:cytoskeletal protein CcmA (bactofilin family)